jgi:hypothetical protein
MNSRRAMKKEIGELLEGLGSSRAEVATTLQALRVRAAPKDPEGCAIARFLDAIVGGDPLVHSISVHRSHVKVLTLPKTLLRPPGVRVSLPLPVRHFVRAFDAGIYPGLVRWKDTTHRSEGTAGMVIGPRLEELEIH